MAAQSALITGASTGFGATTAVALAELGWRVFATMRDTGKADALLAEAAKKGISEQLEILPLDVTDSTSIQHAISQIMDSTDGRIDALLNNAGYGLSGPFEDLSDADCRQQMETNFFGALAVTRAVLPAMRGAGRGRVVVVTSNAVNSPHPMMSVYAASKWALTGWAEALAMEVAPFGIDVRVIEPGNHRTEFSNNLVSAMAEASPYEPWMAAALPGIADLGGWGRDPMSATAPIVRALTSPEAPFLQRLGADDEIFAALKGTLPYEVRAWLLKAILGVPGAHALLEGAPEIDADESGGLDQILRRIGRALTEEAPGRSDGARAVLSRIL